jgi:hypothetical protein
LHRGFVQKSLLQGMQAAINLKAFDGAHFAFAQTSDLRQARAPRNSVNQHGAGAALPFSAAVLRSRKIELISQDAEQSGPRVRVDLAAFSVYFELCDSRHRIPPEKTGAARYSGENVHRPAGAKIGIIASTICGTSEAHAVNLV